MNNLIFDIKFFLFRYDNAMSGYLNYSKLSDKVRQKGVSEEAATRGGT